MLGKSLNSCFKCEYCRVLHDEKHKFDTIPSDINPDFINIPIAINLFYGDPLLQIETTVNYLRRLEEAGHVAPVLIVTKGGRRYYLWIR